MNSIIKMKKTFNFINRMKKYKLVKKHDIIE